MNTKELEERENKLLESLPPEKRAVWLELNAKFKRILQQDPTADDFDMDKHKAQLSDVMNEMDAVIGIRRSAKTSKKTPRGKPDWRRGIEAGRSQWMRRINSGSLALLIGLLGLWFLIVFKEVSAGTHLFNLHLVYWFTLIAVSISALSSLALHRYSGRTTASVWLATLWFLVNCLIGFLSFAIAGALRS